MTEKKNESTFSIAPGQLLAAAREARSLSQADIAKQTRLSVQAINDIEKDDYAQIGVRTFVRGYLCSYARLVNVSEKQILEALDASGLMPSDTHSLLPRIEGAPVMNVTHQQSRKLNLRLIAAVGAGVIALATLITWIHAPKEVAVNTVAQAAENTALLQPITTDSTPAVVMSQPVIVSATHSVKKENKKLAKKTEKTENGFVVKPNRALHTTYTVKPAT